ncbi:MAG TPA: hypothetical protein VGM88_23155 [Kofleriaceae bacterium]
MTRLVVEIEVAALEAGGVFVAGCAFPLATECALRVRGAAGVVELDARVVFVDERGAGLEILGMDAALRAKLDALDRDAPARHVHERMRNLPLNQQIVKASTGELPERIALERLYGKNVWEPLLRNPRLTPPEVARIARMGQLPRPLVEVIAANAAWLQHPEVRRALLANPRLGAEQAQRVLRMLPRHELKLVPTQAAYPSPVRDAARRLLRGGPGDE